MINTKDHRVQIIALVNKVVKHGGLKQFLGRRRFGKNIFKKLKAKKLKFSKQYEINKGLHVRPTTVKDLDDA